MPTYTYKCENGHIYKEVRAMTEDQINTTCQEAECSATLKRVFDTASVQFKGSGWAGRRNH